MRFIVHLIFTGYVMVKYVSGVIIYTKIQSIISNFAIMSGGNKKVTHTCTMCDVLLTTRH